MKVEIWSDVACPFCYIGKRSFEQALNKFADKEQVEVVYRSFELDPKAPKKVDMDVHDMLATKYGMTREKAKEMNNNVGKMAEAVGLTFKPDTMVLTNTFDAHRLAHHASKYDKMPAMTESLYKAYFTDSKHLGDHGVLSGLAEEIGLDKQEALDILASSAYSAEVRADEHEAQQLGVNGVPFFVINRKFGISGAQSAEYFLNALKQAWDEEPKLTILPNEDGSVCTDDGCSV
ncbi:MAG: DsbA family oxidoreductase [Paenibacillaceae bacterium]